MKIDRPNSEEIYSEGALPADFARRVVERVRAAKRRRRIARRTLFGAAACALAAFVILSLRTRGVIPVQSPPMVARRNSGLQPQAIASSIPVDRTTDSGAAVVSDPVEFFFPGAAAMADSRLSETTYWHSYDPWWNPNQ